MAVAMDRLVGGAHPETAVARNALAELGVVAPHTGEPFSEAMLLGVGGGIGGGYFVFEYGQVPSFFIGTRHAWQDGRAFLAGLCDRLGVLATVRETTSPRAAEAHLRASLAKGPATIAWVDLARLPYSPLPSGLNGYYNHVVRVIGVDEAADEVLLDDRAPVPWRLDRTAFAAARAGIPSAKHRLMGLEHGNGPVDLSRAVWEGLQACYRGLTSSPFKSFGGNFGLAAWSKWAELVADERDQKGWPRVFQPGLYLYRALVNTYWLIEAAGTGGGALRPLFARFLDEAGQALERPALHALAGRYRELAGRWGSLARAALPESVPSLRRCRELLAHQQQLLQAHGQAALEQIQQAQRELQDLEAEATERFPLAPGDVRVLLADLRDHLRWIARLEADAAEELRAAVSL
jgi:hypothetical protein